MGDSELISSFAIFSGISESHLSQIARQVEVLEHAPGDMIFQEGDEASHLYGVIDGEVELILVVKDEDLITDVQFEEYARVKTETREREIIVDSIGRGEIFGWSALTSSGRFTSKAVCSMSTKLFALPAESLRAFFTQNPQVGYPFMERLADIIAKRLANRTDRLLDGWSEAFNVNRI